MSEGTKLPARFGQDEQRIPGSFGAAMLIKGLTPYIGENGNWWTGEIDSGIAATGPAGADGPAGEDGKDGTPFTYDMFTAEQLEALRGPRGPEGPPGTTDYNKLENKPFDIEQGVILSETSVLTEAEDGDVAMFVLNKSLDLVEGEAYTVTWNGVEYTCTAKWMMDERGLGALCLGNTSVADTGGTGEPFIIATINKAITDAMGIGEMTVGIAIDGVTSVQLSIRGAIIKHIDNKYLDPFFEIVSDREVFPEEILTFGFVDFSFSHTYSERIPLIPGRKYTVIFDEVEYVCMCQSLVAFNTIVTWLGDLHGLYEVHEVPKSDEPFCVLTTSFDDAATGFVIYPTKAYDNRLTHTEEHTFAILEKDHRELFLKPEHLPMELITEKVMEELPEIGGGTDGKDGITPHIGSNGHWYIGTTDTGVEATGPAGKDGVNGKDGQAGQPGSPGKDGAAGKDGVDGVTPHIGSNGNWYIGTTDTGVAATGPAGKDGTNGKDGEPGKNGATGPAGADGVPGKDGADGLSMYRYNGVLPNMLARAGGTEGNYFIHLVVTGDRTLQVGDLVIDSVGVVAQITEVIAGRGEFNAIYVTNLIGPAGADGKDGADGQPGKDGKDYVLTDADKAEIATAVKALFSYETWTFTLADGSTVTKKVVLA